LCRYGERRVDFGESDGVADATEIFHGCLSEHDGLRNIVDAGGADAAKYSSGHSLNHGCSKEGVEIAVVVTVARVGAHEVVAIGGRGVESTFPLGVGENGVGELIS